MPLEFIGQPRLQAAIAHLLDNAKRMREPLPHLILCGPAFCGKKTLATVIATVLGVPLQIAKASALNQPGELVPYFTNASDGSVFCLEDIDDLSEACVGLLTPAIDEFRLDIELGEGLSARTITMPLKHFTLVGTTTKPSRIHRKLKQTGVLTYDFSPYDDDSAARILWRLSEAVGMILEADAAYHLLGFCAQSMEVGQTLVKKLRKYFGSQSPVKVNLSELKSALGAIGYGPGIVPSADLAIRLQQMDGRTFEEYVAGLFRSLGYHVESTPITGDHGIDLVLRKDRKLAVVQCKCWDGNIGEPVVREFYGSMIAQGANAGFIVTTTNFTQAAATFATGKPIKLIDLDSLLQMAGGRAPGEIERPKHAPLF